MKRTYIGTAVGGVAALCLLLWWPRPAPPTVLVGAARGVDAPVLVQMEPLQNGAPADCTDTFVAHRLDFATGTRVREISTYLSNGAGVAANDLDGDGDLDLVFASVDGQSTILWNEGSLQFRPEALDDHFSRAVAVVDVDGDSRLDIVFTHRGLEPISYWRNTGQDGGGVRFAQEPLQGVAGYAYAMAWGDLDGDGDLDLVTGSYAAELKQHGIAAPEEDERAGLALYERQGDHFVRRLLHPAAETLSLALLDLDGDGHSEIWAANDFAERDQVWQRTGDQWALAAPFAATSHSTMSTDWGDLTNTGRLSLFSTDMNPYDISPPTLARWLPMMNEMGEHRQANDPQIMANVLLERRSAGSEGAWQDAAAAHGVSATGWSWAGRFGDLDNDGFLDLYVVNGMIAQDLFAYLPNQELVEQNQALRNRGDGSFVPAPNWQLDSTASGRGMVMADLDNDGDLDVVVNNLRTFAQLFENRLCGGSGLEVTLQWPAVANRNAVGAVVLLHTDQGVQRRDMRASGGYLSGDPLRLHFGLPPAATPKLLEIFWPDGGRSQVENLAADGQITVTREP